MEATITSPDQIRMSATDPRNNNKVMQWLADVSWPTRDIMVCRDAMPFMADLPKEDIAPERWESCTVMAGNGESEYEDLAQRSSDKLRLTGPLADIPEELQLYGVMLHGIEGWFIDRYMHKNPHARVGQSSGFDLLRYGPGQKFGEHVDVIQGTNLAGRRLSAILFCNDDFTGGDLYFPRQNVRIRPEPGMLVLFPSGIAFPHEAEVVETGTRYAVVAWYF